MKTIRPVRLVGGDTIYFVWKLISSSSSDLGMMRSLKSAAQRLIALGWGVDLVVGHANQISGNQFQALEGERWLPTVSTGLVSLRIPTQGTLTALKRRYDAFLGRIGSSGFVPVEPICQFKTTGYRRPSDGIYHPHAVYELRQSDGSFCVYSQRKLMHIAGMVRHLAKNTMLASPPKVAKDDWVERYVVGHRDKNDVEHSQFSYLPLPSIGDRKGYADQSVRRVIVAAPAGDDAWLEHLAQRISGKQLVSENGNEFGKLGPPTLVRVYRDNVAAHYTRPANQWASVTPVILPGHDDKKPAKTKKLIETALEQSGIDQPCTFDWSTSSPFRKSLSAHKYHKDRETGVKRWQFENVKDYLRHNSWVHLTLTFNDGIEIRGPIAVGAGRHCGFGLMAAWNSD